MTGKKKSSRGPLKKPYKHSKDAPFPRATSYQAPEKMQSFSMMDEARNTDHSHPRGSDQKLRYAPLHFVGSGTIAIDEKEKQNECARLGIDLLKDTTSHNNSNVGAMHQAMGFAPPSAPKNAPDAVHDHESTHSTPSKQNVPVPQISSVNSFLLDAHGMQDPASSNLTAPYIRDAGLPVTADFSDSSEEVIVFDGRKIQGSQSLAPKPTAHPPLPLRYVQDMPSRAQQPSRRAADRNLMPAPPQASESGRVSSQMSSQKSNESGQQNSSARTKKRRDNRLLERLVADEEAIADYIANIRNANEVGEDMVQRAEPHLPSYASQLVCNSQDLQSFNDLSTSDDEDQIQDVLSGRERPSGRQYLVRWKGCSMTEAKWIPSTATCILDAVEKIADFEARLAMEHEHIQGPAEMKNYHTSLELNEIDLDMGTELTSQDPEGTSAFAGNKPTTGLTDGQIAQRLTKQEELGLGSNELLLFDSAEDDQASTISWGESDLMLFGKEVMKQRKKIDVKKLKNRKGGRGSILGAASALIDMLDDEQYESFDVMDFERPSLQNRQKNRHTELPFNLSDSELEASITKSWDKDRAKKKSRKEKREELRAQGLLPSGSKVDMMAKYPNGMTTEQVRDTIRGFLDSEKQALHLPPMDKRSRKVVHEIANVFSVKSKSHGKGHDRHPCLYKTPYTSRYEDSIRGMMEPELLSANFTPRLDKRARRAYGGKILGARRNGKEFTRATASYKEGEVVGAAAPELGSENRGRAMLEKMGWSSGMGIGASDNKGILLPVSHVVKNTRAGLS